MASEAPLYFSSIPFTRPAIRISLFLFILSLAFQLASSGIFKSERRQDAQLPLLIPDIEPLKPAESPSKPQHRDLDFRLRHVFHHGTHLHPNLHRRLDVPHEAAVRLMSEDGVESGPAPSLRAQSRPLTIKRLVDRSFSSVNSLLDHGRLNGRPAALPSSAWTQDEIPGPNVSDKETVLSFARMTSNAYTLDPKTGDWEDVGCGFNYTEHFGWESDGLRGHIFADTKNSTIVVAMKGTSPAVFDGSDTTTNDKENDNLFFSCCCGQGGQYLWRQVCDCKTSTYTCNSTCVVQSLVEKNRYYYAAQDLYHNVSAIYPDADIWLAGHSLGGSVSSLLGLTYGLPVVTFEAPGEALAAARLGLPTPPEYHAAGHQTRAMTGGYHFGHTADPLFMGTCNSASSFCTLAGYAMQTVCHTGQSCIYDTVGDLGWRVAIGTHRIKRVITDVLEKYDDVPKCEADPECVDCYNWKFFDSNGSETTTTKTSTSTSATRTRTQTCKTPGWWGCLDETTTTTGTTTSTTDQTTTSTSSCKTPGWFGCNDPTTSTTTSTLPQSHSMTLTASSTTESGSRTDGDSYSKSTITQPASPSITSLVSSATQPQSSSTCTSRAWFGLICADPSLTATRSTPTASPSSRCIERHWYGSCKEFDSRKDEM